MTMLVTNAGNMFQEESLHDVSFRLGVDDEELRERFSLLRDYYERRRGLFDKGISETETSFYFLSKALHIIGYTHSHNEPNTHGATRPDFTLFENSESFLHTEPGRGTAQFFATALGIVKTLAWELDLLALEEIDPGPEHPAFLLDELLRQTGLQWGILTNGAIWRIYHRSTSGLLTTYYEVNLREILETNDFDAFRYFIGVFCKEALAIDETGTSLIHRLLN